MYIKWGGPTFKVKSALERLTLKNGEAAGILLLGAFKRLPLLPNRKPRVKTSEAVCVLSNSMHLEGPQVM